MELNGMCLIWGWQSTNCFLFELLPAWLGTAVIETIMFHSSLAIIYLKSSFTAILFSFLKSLPLPVLCCQGPHAFCESAFCPGLGSAIAAHEQPACPWTSPTCSQFCRTWSSLYSPPRLCFAFGTSWQGSSDFPLKPRICSGFWTVLCCMTMIIICRTQTYLYCNSWEVSEVTLSPSVPCFIASHGSCTLYRGGCGSTGYMLGVGIASLLTLPIYKQFLLCFHPILINRMMKEEEKKKGMCFIHP